MRLGQNHPDSLRTFQQFDHQRRTAYPGNQILGIFGRMGKPGNRQADPLAGQQLQTAQFVPGAADGDRFVDTVDIHHFKLPHNRRSVKGDGGADAGDDGIKTGQFVALVVNGRALGGDGHIAEQRVDNPGLMTTDDGGFIQLSG